MYRNTMWAMQLSCFLMSPQHLQCVKTGRFVFFFRVNWTCSGDHHREYKSAQLPSHPVECSWTISHHPVHLALETGECHICHHLFIKSTSFGFFWCLKEVADTISAGLSCLFSVFVLLRSRATLERQGEPVLYKHLMFSCPNFTGCWVHEVFY